MEINKNITDFFNTKTRKQILNMSRHCLTKRNEIYVASFSKGKKLPEFKDTLRINVTSSSKNKIDGEKANQFSPTNLKHNFSKNDIHSYELLIEKTKAFKNLKKIADEGKPILILDINGPNDGIMPITLKNLIDKINDPSIFGHGYVIAAMLTGIMSDEYTVKTEIKRNESDYIRLRKFHNNVKRQLIKSVSKKGDTLFDISVGRMGDYFSWNNNDIKFVYGIDPDVLSIEEAKNRLEGIKKDKRNKTEVKLEVARITDKKSKINLDRKFDLISCQFSIHYFFQNQEMFDTALERISKSLKKGGYFIGTTIDGIKLDYLLKNGEIDHKFYNIKKHYKIFDTPFGNKYTFLLKDKAISGNYLATASTEYIVSKKVLQEACAHFGMRLIEYQDFEEKYNNRFNLKNYEKFISFLNFSFIFQKI